MKKNLRISMIIFAIVFFGIFILLFFPRISISKIITANRIEKELSIGMTIEQVGNVFRKNDVSFSYGQGQGVYILAKLDKVKNYGIFGFTSVLHRIDFSDKDKASSITIREVHTGM
jgi:hypothetical protein